jgi:hypothetical protein
LRADKLGLTPCEDFAADTGAVVVVEEDGLTPLEDRVNGLSDLGLLFGLLLRGFSSTLLADSLTVGAIVICGESNEELEVWGDRLALKSFVSLSAVTIPLFEVTDGEPVTVSPLALSLELENVFEKERKAFVWAGQFRPKCSLEREKRLSPRTRDGTLVGSSQSGGARLLRAP